MNELTRAVVLLAMLNSDKPLPDGEVAELELELAALIQVLDERSRSLRLNPYHKTRRGEAALTRAEINNADD